MKKVDWSEIDTIIAIINNSTSKKDILVKMGYNKGDVRQHNRLTRFIVENSINIDHFGHIPEKWGNLPNIINECFSYADILRKLGLSTHGSSTNTAKKYVQQFGLDTSHFTVGRSNKTISDDDVFCRNEKICKSTVRKRFLKLVEYKCAECGISAWNNKTITLEMDHIDGDRYNHNISNLRLLCPNCHSQTPTYGSKKC